MEVIFTIIFGLGGFGIGVYFLWYWGWGKARGSWVGVIEEKNRVYIVPDKGSGVDDWDVTLFIRTDSGKLVTVDFVESDVKNSVKRLKEGDRVKKEEGEYYPVRI